MYLAIYLAFHFSNFIYVLQYLHPYCNICTSIYIYLYLKVRLEPGLKLQRCPPKKKHFAFDVFQNAQMHFSMREPMAVRVDKIFIFLKL